MTRCAAAMRAGRSGKNSAISTGNSRRRARRGDARPVLAARLLGQRHARALASRKQRERGRRDVRHHARALRAAGDQHAQPPVGEIRIGRRGGLDHARAGRDCRCSASWPPAPAGTPFSSGKPVAISVARAARNAIGAAHHRVLLVQNARRLEQRSGESAAARSDSRRSRPRRAGAMPRISAQRRDDAARQRRPRRAPC